jgi:hypothetical protein
METALQRDLLLVRGSRYRYRLSDLHARLPFARWLKPPVNKVLSRAGQTVL